MILWIVSSILWIVSDGACGLTDKEAKAVPYIYIYDTPWKSRVHTLPHGGKLFFSIDHL